MVVDFEQRELGLTWSKRWHAIDPERSDGLAVSRCGTYLYLPAEVLEKKRPSHLMRLLKSDDRCRRRCARSVTGK